MKKCLLGFILFSSVTMAQVKEKLYFFMTKDSLYGVKNNKGKIIILPREVLFWSDEDTKFPITDDLIFLNTSDTGRNEPHSIGMMYNRKGEKLFAPFIYDNGPDWFSEGLMRFVKNGKVGFANRNGDIVIEAKFDFASQFNYGVAWYCNGCVWKGRGEHSSIQGGYRGYVNSKGDTIVIMRKLSGNNDVKIDDTTYISYPFSYSEKEQKIIASFYKIPGLSNAYFVNNYSEPDSSKRKLRFEIVERPSSFYPYYHIKAF